APFEEGRNVGVQILGRMVMRGEVVGCVGQYGVDEPSDLSMVGDVYRSGKAIRRRPRYRQARFPHTHHTGTFASEPLGQDTTILAAAADDQDPAHSGIIWIWGRGNKSRPPLFM